jgi:putative ABC transport system permease protein
MFVVAYDPDTDFTLRPWLARDVPGGLRNGEAIGGFFVAPSEDGKVTVYGSPLMLRANLSPTGTGIDRTLFLTFETAHAIARDSFRLAKAPLNIPDKSISAALVRINSGYFADNVALMVEQAERGIRAIPSPRLFQSYRQQMDLVRGAFWIIGLVSVAGAALVIGLVFTLAANERRREVGVLRAIGATRAVVFGALVGEGALLSGLGGLLGVALSGLAVYLFHELFVEMLGVPFVLPSAAVLTVQGAATIIIAVGIAMLAAAWPAFRMCREEPAQAMRERA